MKPLPLALLVILSVFAGAALGAVVGWYAIDALAEFGRWCDAFPWGLA